MKQNFDTALKYVLIDEGGNDDDKRDHGGRTSRGITQKEYDHWCSLNGKSQGDVFKAKQTDIETIYHDQYWDPYSDDMPSGVDYLFFDISVNAGRTRAVRQFQQALGLGVDGMMGVVTQSAIQNADPVDLINKVSDVRANWYRNLAQFPVYGKGWLNRVGHCRKGALALAKGKTYKKVAAPAEKTKDAAPSTTTVSPETSGGATVATGGILETLNSFKESIEGFIDFNYVKYTLMAIAVFTLAYSIWGFYKRSKVQALQ